MAKISKISIALAALLALLLLSGRLYPANIIDGIFSPSSTLMSCAPNNGAVSVLEWSGLSLIAIMLSVMWAAIGQVLGGAFSGPKYNEFVKGMLWGAVETAALLGLFLALFYALWPYGMENLDKARAYAVLTKNTVQFDFGMMLSANLLTGFLTNLNHQFKVPGAVFITLGVQFAPMFKPLVDILGVMMQLITTAVVMWNAQEFLLCFVKSSMLTILLPAGFFLRGFGLKAGGNALIGIAISMFFVYPYMMNLTGEVVADHLTRQRAYDNSPHLWGSCLDQPICCLLPGNANPGAFDEPFIKNGKYWQTDLDYRISPEKVNQGVFDMKFDSQTATGGTANNWCMYNTAMGNAYKAFFTDWFMAAGSWGISGGIGALAVMKYLNLGLIATSALIPVTMFTFYTMSDIMYFVFVVTMIVPLFIIFVTLTIAKEIAKVLGTEIDLSSLEKLI
ncbi:MAG: hypothetical protein WC861_05380 [Candidatus Micrarchaeia archaeon]